jgi:hypothetical protein
MLSEGLHLPRSRQPITLRRLLVVESHDAFEFFKALLRHLNLLESIEIRNMGGIRELSEYLKTLKAISGFAEVESMGIVRDAETDVTAAFRSVCGSLAHNGLAAPTEPRAIAEGMPRVGVFLFPDCERAGTLETLCLDSVIADPAMPCVEDYFQCLSNRGVSLPCNMSKARVHSFLASRTRPNLLLGQAAQVGYWPWESTVFDRLKQFFQTL